MIDRDDHGGRRARRCQSKPSGGTEGAQFWSRGTGYAKPDSRDGVLEERAASPSPTASGSGDRVLLSSARWVGTALGELTAQAADGFSCNVPPDCLSWYLAYKMDARFHCSGAVDVSMELGLPTVPEWPGSSRN